MARSALSSRAASCGGSGSGPGSSGATTTAVPAPSGAATTTPPGGVGLALVAKGLDQPLYVSSSPGDPRLFIVEKTGRVLITDNSGKRVIILTDLDNDGKFMSPGERATYFANTSSVMGDLRQIYPIARVCQANCDESTNPPILNVNDFLCFQTRFAQGDPYANCDASTSPPILNVNDFLCFQTKFAQGCP